MAKKPKTKNIFFNLTRKAISALLELYNQMFKKLALVSIWMLAAPTLVIASAIFLNIQKNGIQLPTISDSYQLQTQPQAENNISAQVISAKIDDARPIMVEKFLKGTPLANYSDTIVEASDKYGIDWRLVPAIAMKETGGGNAAPKGSFNAWGFENGRTQFLSWEQAIDNVAKTLKIRYIDKGLTTPDEIMPIYAPPALENGGQWAKDINLYFTKIEQL